MNDPVAILKRDHREATEMLSKLEDAKPGARRRSTVQKLATALTMHMDIEEQLLYPVVARVVGAEAAEEAEIEHRLAREALAHLQQMVDEPGFGAVVEMLKAGIKHHVREEEREVFPQLKKELDRDALAELGDQIMMMKKGGRAPGTSSTRRRRPASQQRRPAAARS